MRCRHSPSARSVVPECYSAVPGTGALMIGSVVFRSVSLHRPVVVAVVAVAVFGLSACGFHSFSQGTCVDPTDDCNWSVVVIVNDSAKPVTLRECIHRCGSVDQRLDPLTVAPHRSS